MAELSVEEMPRSTKASNLPPIDVAKGLRQAHRYIAVHGHTDGTEGKMSETMLFARTAVAEESANLAMVERLTPLVQEIAEGNKFTVKMLRTVSEELEEVKKGHRRCEDNFAAAERINSAERKQTQARITGLEKALKDALGKRL